MHIFWLVCCIGVCDCGRRGVPCLLILCGYLGVCVCMHVCLWHSSLTSHGKIRKKKNRLICTSLHRISINLAAISTPGTLITLVLQNSNNAAQTSENKKKYCTQQEMQKHAFRVRLARKISPVLSFHGSSFHIPAVSVSPSRLRLHYIKSKFSRLRKRLP